jgi:hypothetical protein
MVTATATRRWLWFNYAFLAAALGGIAMLVIAPFASSESLVPLLIFGTWFILVSALQAVGLRNVAHTVTVEEGHVLFVGPRMRVRVPVDDITGFRRGRLDWHALGFVLVRTRTHGTIKTAARVNGAANLTTALLGANDQLAAKPAWESHDPARRRGRLIG